MEKSKQFTEEINKMSNDTWSEIFNTIKSILHKFHHIDFYVETDDKFNEKYGINKDFVFMVSAHGNSGKMSYHYKEAEINPDCYYIRPDNYTEVPLLTILHECIKQDTHKPDIKPLENAKNLSD